jgi:outer membrane protein
MKRRFRFALTLALFGCSSLAIPAQPAIKIAVLDLNKIYDTHHETEGFNARLRTDEQAADEEVKKINALGSTLKLQYDELVAQAKNPTLAGAARDEAQSRVQKKGEEIQARLSEALAFRDKTGRGFQDRIKAFHDLLLDEIVMVAAEVAKKKGVTLLVDKAGATVFGASNIIYFDPAYDITDDVIKEIGKTPPASGRSVPPSTTLKPTPSNGSPMISVPGVAPKK